MTRDEREQPLRLRVLVSAQRALLGEVVPGLRMVCCSFDPARVLLRFVYDGAVTDVDHERAEVAATEVCADFAGLIVEANVVRLDWPAPLESLDLDARVYRRWEPPEPVVARGDSTRSVAERWRADWSNEAARGSELIMDFVEGDERYRARLELTERDELVLSVYPSVERVDLPAALVASVIAECGPSLLASRRMVRERDRR